MDPDRFDSLAKRLVVPTSRRATLGGLAAGGLLSALGLGRSIRETRAAQRGTCELVFVATVRQGPNAERVLTTTGSGKGELRGELHFGLSESGTLEDASLVLSDGTSLPVVGQATGHSLQVRIELGPRLALVAVGVGEQEVAKCQGAIDGVSSGPDVGDLGDWHAAVLRQTEGSGGTGSTGGGGTSGGAKAKKSANRTPTAVPVPASGECLRGLKRCGDVCVDPKLDKKHCGACDNACAAGDECIDGTCGKPVACASGLSRCDGVCVDLSSDPNHCGTCQTRCPSLTCSNGSCGTDELPCTSGKTDCGGVCVDLQSDLNNCGACGEICESGLVPVECRRGVCERANCPVGIEYCGIEDGCRDLTSDDEHCGACDNACGPVPGNPGVFTYCENGQCVAPQCPAGTTDCSNYCADLMTSAVHCGVCGKACAAGETCVTGVCTAPAALEVCAQQGQPCGAGGCCLGYCNQDEICECVGDGSQCAGIGTGGCCSGQPCNADGYCGTCGTLGVPCNSDAECCSGQYAAACCFDGVRLASVCTDVTATGVCPGQIQAQVTCPAGQTDCGGVCVDLLSHAGHCGACFNSCPLGGFCSGGTCQGGGGGGGGGCLALGSACTYPVDVCCGGACLNGVCVCSPPQDVCADGSTCCSGVCGGDGFCT
jgi:hypothetical protein